MKQRLVTALLVLVMTLGFSGIASAILVTDLTPNVFESGGVWNYEYILSNSQISDETVWLLALEVGAPIYNILSPANWYVWQDGSTGVVEWDSEYDPDYANDIWPGNLLSGFSFQSNAGPGSLGYQLQGWDIENDDYGTINNGSTLAPIAATAPIPEPSTLLLLSTGLVGVVGFGSRKIRSRKS